MADYRERTGGRLTYESLAERAGLSKATIESLATRDDYNTSLKTVDRLCQALDCTPSDLIEFQRHPR
jgi:DNA-binding Xre family transcriptional regulator